MHWRDFTLVHLMIGIILLGLVIAVCEPTGHRFPEHKRHVAIRNWLAP